MRYVFERVPGQYRDSVFQERKQTMPIPFVTFKPAEYHRGKECYVSFYVTDPVTNKLVRRKVKVNHVTKATERDRYAKMLCHQINEKLFAGWNPLMERAGCRAVSLSDAVNKFLAAKEKTCRAATMRSYSSFCRVFIQYAADTGLANGYCILVGHAHLLAFMEWCADVSDLSNRSWNNYAGFLYTLFDFFKQRGYCNDNPAKDLPRRRVDRKQRTVIQKSDRAVIRSYFEERCPRYVSVMMLCYQLFIRPKEICMLRIADIDFDNRMLRIRSTVAKNHNERLLGIPDLLMEYFEGLKEYPATYYIYADRNTYAPGPKMMSPTRIAEKWKEMRDEMKLPESYQFYSLKDTGITEMLEAGVPAKYVKELADHHSLEMTERYTHRSEARKILEWNRLEF